VRLVARLYRLVWGTDVEPALRPVLAVALVDATSGSASWVFIGIWAKKHLGATDTQLGFAFLAGALLAGGASYVGGHISDHVGRRPMILAGWRGPRTSAARIWACSAAHGLSPGRSGRSSASRSAGTGATPRCGWEPRRSRCWPQ
jgi:MFS family permease